MRARAGSAYVQARVQARHGCRPGAASWHALEASRTGAHALASARGGALAPWVEGVDDAADVHALEARLRRHWARHVDEVASWQPARWRAATRWFGLLPHLGLVAARRRARRDGAASAEGAVADAFDDGLERFGADELDPGPTAAAPDADALVDRWRAGWRDRLPSEARDDPELHRPAALLLPALRGAPAGRPLDDGACRQALERHFRRHAGRPPAVYAHLAIVHLDLERLRGELVVRWTFGAQGQA